MLAKKGKVLNALCAHGSCYPQLSYILRLFNHDYNILISHMSQTQVNKLLRYAHIIISQAILQCMLYKHIKFGMWSPKNRFIYSMKFTYVCKHGCFMIDPSYLYAHRGNITCRLRPINFLISFGSQQSQISLWLLDVISYNFLTNHVQFKFHRIL